MFYSQVLLAGKGPLSKLWLAAHYDRKLKKAHVTATDIIKAADDIVNPEFPLALRMSGNLLLGLARIYRRKVGYLMDDCSDALIKIKLAFRPKNVDLPSGAAGASGAAINLGGGEKGGAAGAALLDDSASVDASFDIELDEEMEGDAGSAWEALDMELSGVEGLEDELPAEMAEEEMFAAPETGRGKRGASEDDFLSSSVRRSGSELAVEQARAEARTPLSEMAGGSLAGSVLNEEDAALRGVRASFEGPGAMEDGGFGELDGGFGELDTFEDGGLDIEVDRSGFSTPGRRQTLGALAEGGDAESVASAGRLGLATNAQIAALVSQAPTSVSIAGRSRAREEEEVEDEEEMEETAQSSAPKRKRKRRQAVETMLSADTIKANLADSFSTLRLAERGVRRVEMLRWRTSRDPEPMSSSVQADAALRSSLFLAGAAPEIAHLLTSEPMPALDEAAAAELRERQSELEKRDRMAGAIPPGSDLLGDDVAMVEREFDYDAAQTQSDAEAVPATAPDPAMGEEWGMDVMMEDGGFGELDGGFGADFDPDMEAKEDEPDIDQVALNPLQDATETASVNSKSAPFSSSAAPSRLELVLGSAAREAEALTTEAAEDGDEEAAAGPRVHKWQAHTRGIFRALAPQIAQQGGQADFATFVQGSSRRTVALAFYDLLLFNSGNVVSMNQQEPYAPISIQKGPNFDEAAERISLEA